MRKELTIPPAALKHRSVELIRVWLADSHQHVVLNIGFLENQGHDELSAWGIALADMIHHIANAHREEYGRDPEQSVAIIRKAFETELNHPTSERLGEFVKDQRSEGA